MKKSFLQGVMLILGGISSHTLICAEKKEFRRPAPLQLDHEKTRISLPGESEIMVGADELRGSLRGKKGSDGQKRVTLDAVQRLNKFAASFTLNNKQEKK
jgi:hypothetical protein